MIFLAADSDVTLMEKENSESDIDKATEEESSSLLQSSSQLEYEE